MLKDCLCDFEVEHMQDMRRHAADGRLHAGGRGERRGRVEQRCRGCGNRMGDGWKMLIFRYSWHDLVNFIKLDFRFRTHK